MGSDLGDASIKRTLFRVSLARPGSQSIEAGYVYQATIPPTPGDIVTVERPSYSRFGREPVRARVIRVVPLTKHIYAHAEV
jgi:hypothetical protein